MFSDREAGTADAVVNNWEQIKREERAAKGKQDEQPSALEGIPKALPALQRASRLQEKAARVSARFAKRSASWKQRLRKPPTPTALPRKTRNAWKGSWATCCLRS